MAAAVAHHAGARPRKLPAAVRVTCESKRLHQGVLRDRRSRLKREARVNRKKHIVILGGGFAGLYVALELEKQLARSDDFEFTLINRENFFLFTPMLHEVAASDLDLTTIVNPVRKFLRRGRFFEGNVERLDID